MPVTDFRVQVGYVKHLKTRRLVRICGRGAIACHLAIWEFAAVNRPDGRMTGLSASDIEELAEWDGEPGLLVKTLASREVRYLDKDEDGTFVIHDWADHQPWVIGAPARSKKARDAAFARHHGKPSNDAESSATSMPGASSEHATSTAKSETSTAPSPSPSPSPSPEQTPHPESVAVPSQVPERPSGPPTATDSPSGLTEGTATAEPPPDRTTELDPFELPDAFDIPDLFAPTGDWTEPPKPEPPPADPRLKDLDDSHRAQVLAGGTLDVTMDLARRRGNEGIRNDLSNFRPLGTWGLQCRPVIQAPAAAAERVLAWISEQVNPSAAESMRKRLLIVPDESRT